MINYSMMGLMTHREHLAREEAERQEELKATALLKDRGIIPEGYDLDTEVLVGVPKQDNEVQPQPTEANKKIMEAMREFMKQQGQRSCNLDPGCESCQ